MRVIVTGGTGFIGRSAAPALREAGHEVVVVSRHAGASAPAIVGDLTRADDRLLQDVRAAKADVMLALAWETEHGKFWRARTNAAWTAAMVRVTEAFFESGGKRVVCAGTCVEYDPPEDGPCIAGETPIAPTFPYSVSKDAYRRMLSWMAEDFGASYAWGRIFLAYGPHEQAGRLTPSIINALAADRPAETSSGKQRRDFVHAGDYGRAFAVLAASDFQGEINMCSGEPVTIAEVARKIGALMGKPELIRIGALPDRPGEPQNLWGDAAPLREAVSFTPAYSLEDGLRDTIEWWRRQPSGS